MDSQSGAFTHLGRMLNVREFGALEPLHEVNEACIEWLGVLARIDPSPGPFMLTPELRATLCRTPPDVRRRAARQIILLVDLKFHDDEWWQAVRSGPSRDWNTNSMPVGFPRRATIQLARATLVLVWHSLRRNAEALRVLFGMSAPVARIISELRLGDIERVAESHYRDLRPRWADRPWFWLRLFAAAESSDERAMRNFGIHALQLLAGEMLPR